MCYINHNISKAYVWRKLKINKLRGRKKNSADSQTRTHTTVKPLDPKSNVYTNFTISAVVAPMRLELTQPSLVKGF